MSDLEFRSWPPGRGSVVLPLLKSLGVHPEPGTGIRELVEYEDFPGSVAERFERAVSQGLASDDELGFLRFASVDFGEWQQFRNQHMRAAPDRLLVSLSLLRGDATEWFPLLLAKLSPKQSAASLLPKVESFLRANPVQPAPLLPHVTEQSKAQLARINLRKENVEELVQDILGRNPSVPGLLGLQCQPSLDAVRQVLLTSAEYRLRQGEVIPDDPPQPERFEGFVAHFDRPAAQLKSIPPQPDQQAKRLEAVRLAAAKVKAAQGDYQPLYGLGEEGKSGREALLRASCDLVAREFSHVVRKSQVRILDVGCNAGFVSFTLAETFPNTIGLDVNDDNIALCHALKANSGSSALFFNADLLQIAERNPASFEALDCVLFLNVIHQLIFAKGISYVKDLLGKLSQQVDLLVVELARPKEYIPFGKDHLLPLDPVEILSRCTDATITKISDGVRPVYTVRRRSLSVGGTKVPYSHIDFSDHPNPLVGRKYYYGSDTFTKVIRVNTLQGLQHYEAEVSGLKALSGLDVSPDFFAADSDHVAGRITMERVFGASLIQELAKLKPPEKAVMMREVIRIAATMAEKGVYQNDLSGHNFIRIAPTRLRMVDFEMSGETFIRDPFASLLWIAFDIAAGSALSYAKVNPAALVLPKEPLGNRVARVAASAYPPCDSLSDSAIFGDQLAAILSEAHSTDQNWELFIQNAWKKLAS